MKGRIIKGVGGLYFVDTEDGIYSGNARGIFRLKNIKPLIGDFVEITITHEEDRECSVDEIFPRKNSLIRPSVSNIDKVFVVFSIDSPKINFDLMDKFIVTAESINVNINICINKIDLVSLEDLKELEETYGKMYNLIFISTYNNTGIDKIKSEIKNSISVFAGPSGVGKSSIINKIFPDANMEIGEISNKIQRGKHTTRHVELLSPFKNSYIIDSPGFTSLFLSDISSRELQDYFPEFRMYVDQCKFNNCFHENEIGCKIKENIGNTVSEKRYKRYLRFLDEIKDKEKLWFYHPQYWLRILAV